MINVLTALWRMYQLTGAWTLLGQLPYIPHYYALQWASDEEVQRDYAPEVATVLLSGVKREWLTITEQALNQLDTLADEVGEIDETLTPTRLQVAFRERAQSFWWTFRLLFPERTHKALDAEFERRLTFTLANLDLPGRPWCIPSSEFAPGETVWVPWEGKARRGRVVKVTIELWQEEEGHADDIAYLIDVGDERVTFCEADVFDLEEGAQALVELRQGIVVGKGPPPPGARRVC